MNMKKTLAGLMAGVVAISAMATVAVSAKAQKADSVTWSTMAEGDQSAESIVYVTLKGATDWKKGNVLTFTDSSANQGTLEVVEIVKITASSTGSNYVIDEDLDRFYNLNKDDDQGVDAKNKMMLLTDAPDAVSVFEIAVKVKSNKDIVKNKITVASTNTSAATPVATNVAKEADKTKKGVLLNNEGAGKTDKENAEADPSTTIEWADLDTDIGAHIKKDTEVPQEIADFLKDAKGATLEFTFEKKEFDASSSDKTFESSTDRYDWASGDMEAAVSLRINNSKVLSVDMAEFDKDSFTAIYNWDEVMAKFQVGSTTGLIDRMQLKINNEKLPEKDGKVIELRLASITAKIPEMAETEDDTMVEDFAAGESATVVEDTLPAATDAPAADAPAATDAPATTDAASNPETGNSAAALLAIPAALAAAAIVAKKRG